MDKELQELSPILNKIIELVKANNESMPEGPVNIAAPSFRNRVQSDAEKALYKYFDGLTDKDIDLIQAIMYIGREGKEYFVDSQEALPSEIIQEALKYLKTTNVNREITADGILSNDLVLDEYLLQGANILGIKLQKYNSIKI